MKSTSPMSATGAAKFKVFVTLSDPDPRELKLRLISRFF
jgi:hypothetical protein